jgi:4-diphosphocytidyl-2-C-methyl-D-erythritol kinase
MPTGPTIRVKTFAKINLALRIVGVRRDGYHELRTIFQAIALFDTLTVRQRSGPFEITCDDPAVPTDATNLVARAATVAWASRARKGPPRDIAVHIGKGIPMQAGLGGGSSDAAAMLRVLADLWHLRRDHLRRTARAIGADVPFFLYGGRAMGLERGDRIVRLPDLPRSHVVVVMPPFGVSTKDAYAWWDRDRVRKARGPQVPARHLQAVNDLQGPVTRRHPEIGRIIEELFELGAKQAAMSGSGAAAFGLFDRASTARTAAEGLRRRGRRIETTRTLSGEECLALAPK